jgi:hypothetical protein
MKYLFINLEENYISEMGALFLLIEIEKYSKTC